MSNVTLDPSQLVVMMNKLRLYFMINGVLALIAIVGVGLFMLMTGGTIFTLLQALSR